MINRGEERKGKGKTVTVRKEEERKGSNGEERGVKGTSGDVRSEGKRKKGTR